MSAIKRRVDRLEGKTGDAKWIIATVPDAWSSERNATAATALAIAAGMKPPFNFIFVTNGYGDDSETEVKLVRADGRMQGAQT